MTAAASVASAPSPRRGRPRALAPHQDMAIAMARHDGIPWKVLMRVYGLSRRRLHDAARRGMAAFSTHLR